jgi:hypothetical protein
MHFHFTSPRTGLLAFARAAALATMFGLCGASGAPGQEPPPPPASTAITEGVPLGSTLSADLFSALPHGDSLFSLLETSQAEMISDRISGGGLGFGTAARFSTFGSSSTETRFRVGDIDITDPWTGGIPLGLPELFWWQRVSVATGLLPADIDTTGSAVTLEPLRPTTDWKSVVEGSTSLGDSLTAMPSASAAPPIARLTAWNRGSVVTRGSIGRGRAGLVFAGAWTRASERDRGGPVPADAGVGSAFAHVVVAATQKDEVRTIAWVQRALFPDATSAVYANPQAQLTDVSTHVQSTWARNQGAGAGWRLFGGYTRRQRTPQSTLLAAATTERLDAGPVPQQVVDTGARADQRLSAGARIARASGAAGRQQLQGGVDIDGAQSTSAPGFNGVIAELVDGLPARLWQYTQPSQTSRRHSTTISAFASARLTSTAGRGALDVALRYESLVAAADGAAQGVNWSTWLPRAAFRWSLDARHRVGLFGGFARSAYQLPLADLAWGDPASARADVFRWTGGSKDPTVGGSPPLFSAGPGGIGRIDPNLRRPYSDDLVAGIDAQPLAGVRLQLAGVGKWERRLLGVVNQSSLPPAYSIVPVADPGLDLQSASGQVLPVANLVLPTAPYRFDDVLVNAAGLTARRLAVKLTTEVTAGRFYMLLAGTAYLAEGVAASQGFRGTENDQGLLGDVLLDPNAALYSRGRLFGDRAFTGKLITVFRFPSSTTLGAIVRYQDGQPFARLVVAPGLNQGPELVRAFPNGDSRFTFTGTLDARAQKEFAMGRRRLAIVVDAYNLTNLSEEVEERVVTGQAFRTPAAIQPPRTVRVGARLTF